MTEYYSDGPFREGEEPDQDDYPPSNLYGPEDFEQNTGVENYVDPAGGHGPDSPYDNRSNPNYFLP
jgi:hypothetical protein